METKFRRVRESMGWWMSSSITVETFPVSGEDANGKTKRKHELYRIKSKGKCFKHTDLYDEIRENPKFLIDMSSIVTALEVQTGAQRNFIPQLLKRAAENNPTVVGTGKPEGIKKARRTLLELKEKAKWLEIESKRLHVLADELSARKVQYGEAFKLGEKKVLVAQEAARVAQAAADFAVMTMDTTDMDDFTFDWYEKSRIAIQGRADAALVHMEVQRAVAAELARANIAATAQLRALEAEARAASFWAHTAAANGVVDLEAEDVPGADGENGLDDGVGAGSGDEENGAGEGEGGSNESEE